MEHLTKQQIVLLTLFTSFVTSIATGIVTVTLMDQTPTGVTNTINRVIENTIEDAGSSGSGNANTQSAAASDAVSAIISNPVNQIANATARAQQSLVRIMLGSNVTGIGVVVASSGVIMTDKSAVAMTGNYVGITSTGAQYPLQIIQTQNDGDIVFLLAGNVVTAGISSTTSPDKNLIPVKFASLSTTNAPQLGETVIALSSADSGLTSTSVSEGIIQKINMSLDTNGIVDASSTILSFTTNIDSSDMTIGSPLFDSAGNILGMKTMSNPGGNFYPIGYLKSTIPSI